MLEEQTWRTVASGEQPGWEWRGRIIAKHIRSRDRVFDFGAGNRKLARLIPPSCTYVPIDAIDELPGTFVNDYNRDFRLPEGGFSVAVCAGFLEYIDDVPKFFRELRSAAPGAMIIFSYLISPSTKKRTNMFISKGYSSFEDLLTSISQYLSHVCLISTVNETYIVKATLKEEGAGDDWNDLLPVDDVFKSTRKAGFLGKLGRSTTKRRRHV